MGASELEGWRQLWAKDPWGAYRDNFHTALICSLIVNALRKKGTRPISFQEFMLSDRETHKARKTAEFVGFLKAVAQPKKRARGKQ